MSNRAATSRRRARLTVEALEGRCLPALFPSAIEFSTLQTTPAVGFALNGFTQNDATASYVRGIGDINGDGLDDLAVGSPGPNLGGPGQVYVVFGRTASFGTGLNLNQLDGAVGFTINGPDSGNASRMSAAGDVNGDGIGDLLVGAPGAKTAPAFVPGKAYVIFGKATGFPAVLNLDSFTAADGMVIVGSDHGGKLGDSVAGVGDVNGDGISDVLVGASGMAPDGPAFKGKAVVVFGSQTGLPASINMTDLNGTNGFVMKGVAQFDATGTSVARAGDVNGDGKNDLLIGASGNNGKVFVVYGGGPFAASLELSTLNGANGFVITPNGSQIGRGAALAGGGDFNGDGQPDIAIGSWNANGGGLARGAAYIVYGRSGSTFPATYPLSSLGGAGGFDQGTTVFGSINGGQLGSSVDFVDFNNDGVSDLLTGAPIANHFNSPNGAFSGIAYVVFGRRGNNGGGEVDVLNTQGYSFEMRGFGTFSNAGHAVASAGDINHDGAADLIVGMPNPQNPSDKRPGRAFVLYGKFGRPTAQMLGGGTVIRGGGLAYDFKLSFANSTLINVSTLGAADVVVIGPNGQPVAAQYIGYDAVTETATYRIAPTDGVWDFRDNGLYAIHLVANQVFDIFGNAVPGAGLGSFVVNAVPKLIAVGTNVGGRVQTFTTDGTPLYTINAFPAPFAGGVRVAVGDVNADGIPDVIAAPGGGTVAEVKVFDGRDGSPLAGYTPIRPYGPAWMFGAYVAAGDVDGVPGAEVIVGPGRNSMQPIVAFKTSGQIVSRFRAYGTNIVGGVRIAAGNLAGDARAEIVTAAGSGVSVVKAFNQAGRQLWARQPYAFAGGVFVTVGDVNGDGLNEVITGPEGPNQPYVRVYRGFNGFPVVGQVASYPPNFFLGNRVGMLDVDGDGRLEVLVSTAGARTVLVYNWVTKRRVDSFAAFDAAYSRGLFVAGG